VTPLTGEVTRNTTFVFAHTVAADTRVIPDVAGTGATYAVTVEERAPVQEALAATAVTDLVPVEAPLTV
jgi:hypothetical protein